MKELLAVIGVFVGVLVFLTVFILWIWGITALIGNG